MAEGIRTGLSVYGADSSNNFFPTEEMIHDYPTLRSIVTANGETLPETEELAGVTFMDYATHDTDGDGLHDSYSMRLRVAKVSTTHIGWCVVIAPEGIEKCDPQARSSS